MKPDTFREGILGMAKAFDPVEGKDLTAVIQFNVSGQEPGCWHFVIDKAQCGLKESESQLPVDLAISVPSEVWLRIMRKELNGAEAFLTGQATVTGDMMLLLRLGALFSQYK
jgi:putative sterol carrier protein